MGLGEMLAGTLTKVRKDDGRKRWHGFYRAVCADNCDPEKLGRIRVSHPLIWGPGVNNVSPWAWPLNMSMAGGAQHLNEDGTVQVQGDMGSFTVPVKGSPVWVTFEDGNPEYPIYATGYWGGSADGNPEKGIHVSMAPAEAKRLCPEQYPCFGDEPRTCLDCQDALEHAVEDSYDDIEHRPFHDHREGLFYCPRMRVPFKSETGHTILANDKHGREFLAFVDRTGQCLVFKGRILPELQVGEWADETLRGNARQRGERIMSRATEFVEEEGEPPPALDPTPETRDALAGAGLTQADVPGLLDRLLDENVRAAITNTPLGNVLALMDSATLNGIPLKPSDVFNAFVGGASAAAQQAVTAAMAVVGTSPQALLSSAIATLNIPGILDALPLPVQTLLDQLLGAGLSLAGVFPSILAKIGVEGALDGFDPRENCPDQWASWELRDLARGFTRFETAAVLDAGEVEGASAAPGGAAAATLASLGLTQAGLVTLAAALSLPDVQKALVAAGTPLGTVLQKVNSLTLNGTALTIDTILGVFTGGASAAARNAVTSLLATVNLTPLGIVNTISTFTLTPGVLAAVALIPGAGAIRATVGAIGMTALGATLMAIPGAGLVGGFLSAFGLMGFTSLLGFFPSLAIVIGEKAIVWRSDRDLIRHQSIVIDHAIGQEKIILSGLNLEGEQVGPQMILDSTLGGRVTIVDPVSGSFENLECSTGGTKEALYEGGRMVGTGMSDLLNVAGDWLCMVGFPSSLPWREPIDVLPLLDEKAYLAPQMVGGAAPAGFGNILHAAMLTATRWAGLSIFDVATLNYTRLVGGIDTVNVGGAQFFTVGGAQTNTILGARISTIGGADVVNVGITHTVNAAANIVHNSVMHIINAGTTASHYAAVEYDVIGAEIHLHGASTPVTKLPLLPVALVEDAELAALAGIVPAVGVLASAP